MSSITEIAPDVYRISTYVPEFDLQFNQFLVKDDEPLLYHTGTRAMFPLLFETVRKDHRTVNDPLDRLQPLRGGRMRCPQPMARSGTFRRGRVYLRGSGGQRERFRHPASPHL